MIQSFKAAARASVPIIAIQSPDSAATIFSIESFFGTKRPLFRWDICGGLVGINAKGQSVCRQLGIEPALTQNPVETLAQALQLPDQSLLFLMNAHLYLDQPTFIQAIANLRDTFKTNQRMIILLGPSFNLGPELVRDILVMDEPLPEQEALVAMVEQQFVNAQLTKPSSETLDEASKLLRGCSLFEAEQIAATSLTPRGLDFEALWSKKKLLIAQTPGMSLWDGKETFESIGGLAQMKARWTRVVNGRSDPGLILFFDEVEKMFGGATSDSSGVSQDFHGQFLSWLQDNDVLGAILVGVSGGGKSLISKAAGTAKRTGRIPVLSCDVGAMKSSLVGSSEARFRNFLKVAQSLAGPRRIIVVMTCNDLRGLSPELKARMTLGTFFFDQPTEEERASIWPLYLERYALGTYAELPDDLKGRAWTGREIKACCETAWNEDIPILEAAENIVPVSITDADRMNRLREQAHNAYLSASYPGVYRRDRHLTDPTTTRSIDTGASGTGDAWDQIN
jgi:hypothetical protein